MLQKSESKRLTMTKNWDSNLQRKVGFLPIFQWFYQEMEGYPTTIR